MRIIRHNPTQWITPFTRWPSLFEDEEWSPETRDLSMYETDDDLVIKANVAGVPSDKVEVSLEGGVVTIRAEHQETDEEKSKKKVVYKESRSAQYLYTTSIPTLVKSDKARAEVRDGVLTLTIPKAEESKPTRIKVTAEGK
jgi:HSP20 family protein